MAIPFPNTLDSIVMLTWSDWHTEPRSNRYHFAVRFARHRPVYFVQPDGHGDEVTFEAVAGHDITLVHIAPDYGPRQAARLAKALRERGVTRPLVWIYNVFLANAVPRLHPTAVVFHATEDYVAPADTVSITERDISSEVRAAVAQADMIVAVSDGVAESYRQVSPPGVSITVLPNGCDFAFWRDTGAAHQAPTDNEPRIALFQGGINGRLDYSLLTKLAKLLPDWSFWFCGKSVDCGEEWSRLKLLPNVKDFGFLPTEGIADLARQATVGLIPFKDSALMRRSLPLKAYEYLACGLPVVTIPIDALADKPDLFAFAATAEEFAAALSRVAPMRNDPTRIVQRLEAAAKASYDERFGELVSQLDAFLVRRARLKPSLNVLMLYDDRSTHVGTIVEHLESFRTYSRHRIHYMPATGFLGIADDKSPGPDFSCYDAIAIHYSVRVSIEEHLSQGVAAAITGYRGPKLLFIQDEYDRVETARRWIERLGIDAVFTNIPPDSIETIYPRGRFPKVDFIPTLTGYVPEDPFIDEFALPMAERQLRIAYRGRTLPHHYGELGQEKYRIGIDVRRLAQERGLPIDIEVGESKRIYGLDWYRFIGSARSTLGTESGANVFDVDGRLAELAQRHASMPFSEFARSFLREHEGLVRMNQISPKIFEAARLRTALILFEGSYSGVIKPNEHYIPLAKDYSNIGEVFSKLEDTDFLQELTDRTFRDVIATGAYSYRRFVEGVDDYLSSRAGGRRRATIVSAPLLAIYGNDDVGLALTGRAEGALLNDVVLGPNFSRERITAAAERALEDMLKASIVEQPSLLPPLPSIEFLSKIPQSKRRGAIRLLRKLWHMAPQSARNAALRDLRALSQLRDGPMPMTARLAKPFWQMVPTSLRNRIAARIR